MSPVRAQGPENVLVVVNKDSPDSIAIANRYVQLRNVPAVNVVYLRGITTLKNHGPESTSSKAFQREILNPILKAMKGRGIEDQIDCIAYSPGFPTRINFNPELKRYLNATGIKYKLQLHAPWASITSLTYFHQNAFSRNPDFLELDANNYANPRRMTVLANPFTGKDAVEFRSAISHIQAADFNQAIEKLIPLGRVHRRQVPVIYALAWCFASTGEDKKAINLLEYAAQLGFASRSLLEKAEAFFNIRTQPEFKKIVAQMEDLPDGAIPTRSFSAQTYWAKNGWPSGNNDQGERYLLSSVLAVTGQNQSTLDSSLIRLTDSASVDGTKPRGNVYFADHKDVRSKVRRHEFSPAVKELKSLGQNASIGSAIYPTGDSQVIGATLGSAAPKWSKSKSKFVPGAICDNLTSYGASWQKPAQTQITEWLDAGAAGASGTVYEPFAIAAKFPSARWHAHYARGCTLAESYYQSVSGPVQLLLVGDPLCCPFGNFPRFSVEGLKSGTTVKADFELQINAAANGPNIRSYEMFYDGVFVSAIENPDDVQVAIDGMKNGRHEIRIVGIADTPTANRTSKRLEFAIAKND